MTLQSLLSIIHPVTLPRDKEWLLWGQTAPNSTTPSSVRYPEILKPWHSMFPNLLNKFPHKGGATLGFFSTRQRRLFSAHSRCQGTEHSPDTFLSHSTIPSLLPRGRTPCCCWGHNCDLETAPVRQAPRLRCAHQQHSTKTWEKHPQR